MGYPLEEQMTINDQVFIRPIRALHTIETAQIITLSTESKFTTACGKVADHWLHLPIEDLEYECPSAPTIEHIKQVLAFAKPDCSIVCACDAGISRSSATAIGLLAARGMKSTDAVALCFERSKNIWPNMMILSFFDRLLGLDGLLGEACKKKKGEIVAAGDIAEE